MQKTSTLYNEILAETNHWFEVSLAIGDTGRLITEYGEVITFGDTSILVDSGTGDSGYRESVLFDLNTHNDLFSEDNPVVGSAVAAEIDVRMLKPIAEIPKRAMLRPYVRATDGERYSEWLQKGVFYVDTRQVTKNDDGLDVLDIHGYDAMLLFNQNYPSDSVNTYPMTDIDMVRYMASDVGIALDERTVERMNKGYTFPIMAGYSCHEVLEIIAASYGGNFAMSDEGALMLVTIGGLPKETNYLVDQVGNVLVFGDVKILV